MAAMDIEWPFRLSEAQAGGAVFRELRRRHAPVCPGVWAPRGVRSSCPPSGPARPGCGRAARTAYDLGRRLPVRADVQRIDALMNATDVKVAEVEQRIRAGC